MPCPDVCVAGAVPQVPFLGMRKRDEKGRLGAYQWMTYAQARRACCLTLLPCCCANYTCDGRRPSWPIDLCRHAYFCSNVCTVGWWAWPNTYAMSAPKARAWWLAWPALYLQAGEIRTALGSGLLQLGLQPKASVGLYAINSRGAWLRGCVAAGGGGSWHGMAWPSAALPTPRLP